MKIPTSLLFLKLVSLAASVGALNLPPYFQEHRQSRSRISASQIARELGPQVSNGTLIYGSDDIRFANATSRWSEFKAPQIQVVVVPAEELDVATIVEYSSDNSIPFLTVNRGHGWTASLGNFDGIQIDMALLNTIDIQPDGKSAWFGGGAYDGQVSRYLWEQGFVATTGACDCVGMMGPGLGGGFGRHGGLYGLISDNIITLNVVLANGTAITVDSESHVDLLWGMKGAGHNFGIVTSFQLHIYPRGPDTWHFHNYVWRGDKVEAVFGALNDFAVSSALNSTPVNMTINEGSFLINSTITTTEPVIWWTFAYRGSAEEAEALLEPFNAIESAWDLSGDIPYPDIPVPGESAESSIVCQHGSTRITSTTLLKTFNLTTERQIFDSFQERINNNPELAAGGNILQEGYSNEGVTAIPSEASAYPWRSDVHLTLVTIDVDHSNDTLIADARQWADEVRQMWLDGQPGTLPHTYVNYANGFESVESIYGYESWRLERLRDLKKRYDPNNAFRYYNPIVVDESDERRSSYSNSGN